MHPFFSLSPLTAQDLNVVGTPLHLVSPVQLAFAVVLVPRRDVSLCFMVSYWLGSSLARWLAGKPIPRQLRRRIHRRTSFSSGSDLPCERTPWNELLDFACHFEIVDIVGTGLRQHHVGVFSVHQLVGCFSSFLTSPPGFIFRHHRSHSSQLNSTITRSTQVIHLRRRWG